MYAYARSSIYRMLSLAIDTAGSRIFRPKCMHDADDASVWKRILPPSTMIHEFAEASVPIGEFALKQYLWQQLVDIAKYTLQRRLPNK